MPEYIIGRSSDIDPSALRLYTTGNKRFVQNERPDSDRSPQALMEARKLVRSISPSAKCRSLTGLYNCVGLTCASRRTIVDIDFLKAILSDDGYKLTTERSAVEGDLVVYLRDGIARHVGVVQHFQDVSPLHDGSILRMWVLSQWGEDGEYLHPVREVPAFYGTDLEFWTERRPEP
jgi:hypothetical protein